MRDPSRRGVHFQGTNKFECPLLWVQYKEEKKIKESLEIEEEMDAFFVEGKRREEE